jgi:hypothetical protein
MWSAEEYREAGRQATSTETARRLFRQAELMERQASERIRAAVPVVEVRIVIERSR